MNTNSLITSSDWLASATKKLESKNIGSARLDALLILEQVLELPRIKLISEVSIGLSDVNLVRLDELLNRRLEDEPMAYIRGFSSFYNRDFIVNKDVLIPRPESESFINIYKTIATDNQTVADIGSGSGCLGITVKLEFPNAKVFLIDISKDAIEVAMQNAKNLGAKVEFKKLDAQDLKSFDYDVALVNLPYVPDYMGANTDLSYEPKVALFAGTDGLNVYRDFWKQMMKYESKPSYILCESLKSQHSEISNLAKSAGFRLSEVDGLVQLFKAV